MGTRMMLAAALLLAGTSASAKDDDSQGAGRVGAALPHVAALDMRDQPVSAASMLARPGTKALLVQFMTVDCKPCKAELKEVVLSRAALDAAGVGVLVVDLMDEPARLEACVREVGATELPVIRDRTGAILELFKLKRQLPSGGVETAVPLAFVVDGKGVLRRILRGGDEGYVRTVLDVVKGF